MDSDHRPLLVPAPQQLELRPGELALPDTMPLRIQSAELWPLGKIAAQILAGVGVKALPSAITRPTEGPALKLMLNPALGHSEAYQLGIASEGILIEARDQAGLFYGLMTLRQLMRQAQANPTTLPCLLIRDWPDFAARGIMIDISRDKVPSLETLKMMIDDFAAWKINQLQLYTEHTFAYAGHEVVWEQASPLTPQDILELDAYCAERFIELVPNQNSFGHMARWLKHAPYAHLSETGPEGFMHPLRQQRILEPFSLCPLEPGSEALMAELYDQLLPHFRSRQFNIGADETFDLGQGRSQQACAEQGKGKVYLDFLTKLQALVASHGRLMQFWGDIVLNHPELIPQLPRPCIALNWGYEAQHPFEAEGAHFARAGVPYYVCPGTSSWNTIGGRTDNMQGNLLNAARAGHTHAAAGYLITDWGDNGHWQPLPVSLPGFVYGAALAWATDANANLPLAQALDMHVFEDTSGLAGETWLELGTIYRLTGVEIMNQSVLFHLLHFHDRAPGTQQTEGLTLEGLAAAEQLIGTLLERSQRFASERADTLLLKAEFALAAGLMRHSCRLAAARMQANADIEALPAEVRHDLAGELDVLLRTYRGLWLARNRPGGLDDSLRVLEHLLARYGTRL